MVLLTRLTIDPAHREEPEQVLFISFGILTISRTVSTCATRGFVMFFGLSLVGVIEQSVVCIGLDGIHCVFDMNFTFSSKHHAHSACTTSDFAGEVLL